MASSIQGIASLEGKLYKLSLMPNSAQTSGLLADIWRQTGELNGYLSSLNLGDEVHQAIFTFLNQAGDYAKQLFLRSAGGGALEQEDAGQILKLQGACAQLEQNLKALASGICRGRRAGLLFPRKLGLYREFFRPGVSPADLRRPLLREPGECARPQRCGESFPGAGTAAGRRICGREPGVCRL